MTAAPPSSRGVVSAVLLLLAGAACSSSSPSVPPVMQTTFVCSGGPTCNSGQICAIILGQPTCQPPPDCTVFCLGGDAGGQPNPCALFENNVCPDETAHNKVFQPNMTTCAGTGDGLVITCVYD